MKKIILSCACAMLLAFPMEAQKKSAVSFDSYEWNFGKVNAAEGAVCHTFTLKKQIKGTGKHQQGHTQLRMHIGTIPHHPDCSGKHRRGDGCVHSRQTHR